MLNPKRKDRRIVAVGVQTDKETGEDETFTIEFNTGGILQTEGDLTKETCRLIRHLQAEVKKRRKRPNNVYGEYEYFGDNGKTFRGDKGEASRFFYCAKASKSERNLGCDELDEKKAFDYGSIKKSEGRHGENTLRKNNHPTVKPIKLMEYLVKLVSKEGATVLDPFLGSGTTGIACAKLGRGFIGIEKEEEYIKIAEARLKPYLEQGVLN